MDVGQTGEPWTEAEVKVAVTAYFRMLLWQELGHTYSKSQVRSVVKQHLPTRSDKSIDLKWCNVSAVLAELKLPWIQGFKPMPHVQQALRMEVESWLRPESLHR